MEISNNPFLSETFTHTWARHFAQGKEALYPAGAGGPGFVPSGGGLLATHLGGTQTKGLPCPDPQTFGTGLGHTVYRVFDVPGYFDPPPAGPGLLRVRQYPGYLIDLKGVGSLEEYLSGAFSKSSRYKLRKYKKRLEQSFDIRYEMHRGPMEEAAYQELFAQFRRLLEKRFADKGEVNNNLDPREWDFYRAVAHPLMAGGRAGLFVVYQADQPIAITLNYFSERIVFDAITVFDIDYDKFHLGSVSVMALIEWCTQAGMEILDFSKGDFDYKARWATRKYDFDYCLLYNPRSPVATLVAHSQKALYTLKQALREKGVNQWFHRLRYRLGRVAYEGGRAEVSSYSWMEEEAVRNPEGMERVGEHTPERQALTPAVFEFLYLKGEHLRDVTAWKDPNQPGKYLIRGKGGSQWVVYDQAATVQ
jgi:hypothetical protein